MRKKWLARVIPIVLVMSVLAALIVPFGFANAQTSAQITVTATGQYVSFSSNVSTYSFGTIATSSTSNTSGTYILLTNTSSVSTNISVKILANAWTSSGTGWTHSDTAAGANTEAMKANSSNATTWASSVFIKYAAPANTISTNLGPVSNVLTGLSLLAPTSFTDGNSNNNTIEFDIVAS